jgi:hypothetical protein
VVVFPSITFLFLYLFIVIFYLIVELGQSSFLPVPSARWQVAGAEENDPQLMTTTQIGQDPT